MKHVRFYQDFGDGVEGRRAKRNSYKTGELAKNALALFLNDTKGSMEALGSLTNDPDSHVAMQGCSMEYLRKHCKRCSESVARQIHPNLFQRLDNDGKDASQIQMDTSGAAGYGVDKYGADPNAKPPENLHPLDVYKYDPKTGANAHLISLDFRNSKTNPLK